MISNARQNPASAFDKAVCHAIAALCSFAFLAVYSNFTITGLLSSRSNAFRTQTVTDRDGAGRVLTQAVTAGSATPLSETQTWLADGRLDAYSAVRVGANAWNEVRDYQYNSRGQLTNEPFAPRPAGSAELTYGFDALGLRIAAKVGAGGNSNWFANATSVYTTQEIAVDSINDSLVTSSASGVAFGAARVELDVDGVPIADALHPGWADATGAWSANLTLTPGQHSLTARAVHPSGWETDPVTSTFTVNGTPQTVTNYSYDQVGNLVWRSWSGGKDQVFTWDAQGRLVNVEEYADGYLSSTWTAAYDGLGRRLRTTTTPYGGATTTINSSFDPQAEFLEVGVNVNGVQNWKVHGPDPNGSFGGLNGTGGLEAVISPAGTTGTITDSFGNVVASVSGNGTVSWNFTKVGSYGPLPNSSSRTLESGATLIEASTWRNRRLDPTGYVNLGARHYDPTTGRFICPDPLGHGSSWSLYDFADGDGVNNFDADGRLATGYKSGWDGSVSSGASNSGAFQIGMFLGGGVSGGTSGLGQGASDLVAGDYGNGPMTWDRTAGQLGVGLTPVGIAADMRDWSKSVVDLRNGNGSWGRAALSTLFLVPGASELGKIGKLGSGVADATRQADNLLPVAAKTQISNPGPSGFVLVGEGSLHSTVAVRNDSLVNRVFDSGFATNPVAAQPLGRYFGEGGVLPTSASSGISTRGLNLPGIVNDAQVGAVYRANTHIPALKGPAAGGTGTELIINPSYFKNLQLQDGYVPIAP